MAASVQPPPPGPGLVSEILDKAAGVIERNGWARGLWYEAEVGVAPEDCKVCAGAAINIVLDCAPDFDHDNAGRMHTNASAKGVFTALARRVDERVREDIATGFGLWTDNLVKAITRWNDEDGRTAEQVIAELRAAAEAERSEGR